MFNADGLRRALHILGQLLADRGLSSEIVVIGGGALLLRNWIDRPTNDLDALAVVEAGTYRTASPFPPALLAAIADTADLTGLDPHWFNPGPTAQLTARAGEPLPPGFRGRTSPLVFGGLTLHLAGRFDQICFKLHAATDRGPESKHVADLIALVPTDDELRRAAVWVKSQDIGVEFQEFVDQVIEHLEACRAQR